MNAFKLYVHISPSWKYYVGITSLNTENRWGKSGNGYKSQYFGRAIKKYGWDNFIHIVVAENLKKSEACELEKIFIKNLKSNHADFGYNISIGGDCSSLGFHHKEKAKRRIAQCLSIPVAQYTTKGNFIKMWDSMKEAGREMQIDSSAIAKCCKGEYKTSHGYVWRYRGDEFGKYDIKKQCESSKRMKVKQFSKNGKLIKIWDSISEAAENVGISSSTISQCCKGIKGRKTVKGYVWRYEKDTFLKYSISNDKIKKVAKIENGEVKGVYNSLVEAGRENNVSENNICMCCKGYLKTAGGVQWSYV